MPLRKPKTTQTRHQLPVANSGTEPSNAETGTLSYAEDTEKVRVKVDAGWIDIGGGGGGGTVNSVNAGTGISITGPATDPVVNNTGVLAVNAGTGISVSGTSTRTVTNTGILSVTAGSNISITGTAQHPVINGSGGGGGVVNSVTGGTGITVTGTASDPVVNNDGVLNVVAGTGISVTGTQVKTVANTGVLAVSASTGLSVSGTQTNRTFTNTGVLGVSAGSNIIVTGTAQNPIINSTAGGSGTVTSVNAGTGITITGTPTVNPTVNNSGVLAVTASTGISITGTNTNRTISNTGTLSVSGGTNVTITGTFNNPTVNAASWSSEQSYSATPNPIVLGAPTTRHTIYRPTSLLLGNRQINVPGTDGFYGDIIIQNNDAVYTLSFVSTDVARTIYSNVSPTQTFSSTSIWQWWKTTNALGQKILIVIRTGLFVA